MYIHIINLINNLVIVDDYYPQFPQWLFNSFSVIKKQRLTPKGYQTFDKIYVSKPLSKDQRHPSNVRVM